MGIPESPYWLVSLTVCSLTLFLSGNLANLEDPDRILSNAAFHHGLHCLLINTKLIFKEGIKKKRKI